MSTRLQSPGALNGAVPWQYFSCTALVATLCTPSLTGSRSVIERELKIQVRVEVDPFAYALHPDRLHREFPQLERLRIVARLGRDCAIGEAIRA